MSNKFSFNKICELVREKRHIKNKIKPIDLPIEIENIGNQEGNLELTKNDNKKIIDAAGYSTFTAPINNILQNIGLEHNGTYDTPINYDAYNNIEVNVKDYGTYATTLDCHENGVYEAEEGKGYGVINVNIPSPTSQANNLYNSPIAILQGDTEKTKLSELDLLNPQPGSANSVILRNLTDLDCPLGINLTDNVYECYIDSNIQNIDKSFYKGTSVEFNVDEANPYYQSINGALYDKLNKKLLYMSNYTDDIIIPDDTIAIDNFAFGSGISNANIFIPDSLQIIEPLWLFETSYTDINLFPTNSSPYFKIIDKYFVVSQDETQLIKINLSEEQQIYNIPETITHIYPYCCTAISETYYFTNDFIINITNSINKIYIGDFAFHGIRLLNHNNNVEEWLHQEGGYGGKSNNWGAQNANCEYYNNLYINNRGEIIVADKSQSSLIIDDKIFDINKSILNNWPNLDYIKIIGPGFSSTIGYNNTIQLNLENLLPNQKINLEINTRLVDIINNDNDHIIGLTLNNDDEFTEGFKFRDDKLLTENGIYNLSKSTLNYIDNWCKDIKLNFNNINFKIENYTIARTDANVSGLDPEAFSNISTLYYNGNNPNAPWGATNWIKDS